MSWRLILLILIIVYLIYFRKSKGGINFKTAFKFGFFGFSLWLILFVFLAIVFLISIFKH